MQCLLIWQSSWHLLCNIHCIITYKYIVHKVISARVQWAVLVYKGSCREGGGSVLLSVKVTWRSREALEGSQQCTVQQCNGAQCRVQGSQPHCRLASAPTRGSTVQPFVPHRLPLSTFTLVVLLHIFIGWLVSLLQSVPPCFLALRAWVWGTSRALCSSQLCCTIGERSVQSPLESSTIMTH